MSKLRKLLSDAESGKAVGVIAAVHYGGSDYEYIGDGSFCANPMIGVMALYRLATILLPVN